jgi:two-component system, NtrC family, nitrogen regulation sensor histidine kinase NtrY
VIVTLRNRLFVLVAVTVALAVAIVTWFVSASARQAFQAVDDQRTAALVAQWRREFAREGDEVVRQIERVAGTDTVESMALDLESAAPDLASHVTKAAALAGAHGLDFLDLVADDGSIVSSAHWPARFGYKRTLPAEAPPDASGKAFLQIEEEPQDGHALALLAERTVRTATTRLHVIGGRRLDPSFLAALGLPAGMRLLLYRSLEPGFVARELIDATGPTADARPFEPLISRARSLRQDVTEDIAWPDGHETVQAIPLAGRDGSVPGVLLVGSSRRELAALVATIQRTGLLVGGLGVCLGFALSYVLASRVTRPIERLAAGARQVAAGDWDVKITAGGAGEVGALSDAFNAMTAQLASQRERLVQAERVAAWRELARRLAHELKNPLFPLKLTVENLKRARALPPAEFEEVFDESTSTLASGLTSLTGIIGRFSDFAKMPPPEFEQVELNDLIRRSIALIGARFTQPDRPAIAAELDLDAGVGCVGADPDQLSRALQNLLLNAIDAMPAGGRITVRTRRLDQRVRIEVADTGEGLTDEECTRLFTPYYTTKQHGTGLGLAIVQSVVTDHGGRIHVESRHGAGTTFVIDLATDPAPADAARRPEP